MFFPKVFFPEVFRHTSSNTYRFTQKLLPLILAGVASTAYAETGKIRLTAIDSNTQRPVSNANITIVARDGTTRENRTNAQGLAHVDALDAGLYTVVINHP